ncbi:MAG: type II toxin-antitoxin system VapB family antitoxin [Candidatus Parabeggiatoa sp.]
MKITNLTIEDNLFIRASQLTGIVEQTTLLKAALKAFITFAYSLATDFYSHHFFNKDTRIPQDRINL